MYSNILFSNIIYNKYVIIINLILFIYKKLIVVVELKILCTFARNVKLVFLYTQCLIRKIVFEYDY